METKLLPCPWCGGEATICCCYGDIWGISNDWHIECTRCGATNINPTQGHLTEEAAIEAWNTRYMPPCETCPQTDNPDSFIFHLLQIERRADDAD